MRIKITHYGESCDPYADSYTEAGYGNVSNKLTEDACALTLSAQKLLDAKEFDWLRIDFGNGVVIKKQFQDRCPNSEERVDVYNPHNLDWNYPDYADVSLV